MVILYVLAAVAASLVVPLALGAWNRGAQRRRRVARVTILPAFLLLAACNAGGLLEVNGTFLDGGTGGESTEAGTPCAEQDPTCPESFPHALTCRFYDGGPCQLGQCIDPWRDCNGDVTDGCETLTDGGVCSCFPTPAQDVAACSHMIETHAYFCQPPEQLGGCTPSAMSGYWCCPTGVDGGK